MNQSQPTGTGSAPLIKVGHTATDKFGTNPDVQQLGGKDQPRDLNIK